MRKLYLLAALFILTANLSAQIITNYTAASTKGGLCNNEVNAIIVEKNNTGRWQVGTNNGITNYYGFFTLTTKQDTLIKMKDNCIHAFVDDTQFRWVCTNGGVAKCSIGGSPYINYTTTDGLIDNHVNAAAVDASGNKWFGTNNGISRFTNTVWTSYNTANGLVDNHVNAVAIDKDGSKWFGTNSGISIFDGTTWTTYTMNDGLVDNRVNAIAIDKNGIKWITTNNGISKFDGITWTTYNTNNGLVNNTVQAVAIDTGNNPWFGTDGGVSSFNATTSVWATYTTANGLVNNSVHAITIDSNNGKFFGTYGGLSKFDGTTWTTYTANGVPSDFIYYSVVDNHNYKWFATICGVVKFDGATWTTYNNANSGLLSNQILSIDTEANGCVWIGTRKGASSFDGTNWTSYTPSNGLPDLNVFSTFFDKQGNKWFATALGVTKFDGTTWTTYDTSNGLVNNVVSCIAQDLQGKMWFGTNNGISRFDGTTWTSFGGGNISKIVVDAHDNKWIGTLTGVMKYNNIGFTNYHTTQYIPSNGIIDLTIDLQGNIWFATNSGMAKFDGANWTTYTTSTNVLLGYNLETIVVDLDGIKWLGVGQRGIVKFDDRFVTLSSTSIVLPAEANNSGSVDITSNTRWTVSANQSWLSIGAISGTANGTISLTATSNPTTSDRTATVTITSSDLSTKTVTVTQAGRIIVPQPVIGIQGNSVSISSHGNTPSFADQTNFGSAEVTNGTATRTFNIQNTGEGALTFSTSTAPVTIGGANASDFSVTTLPASTIDAGGSGSFIIQFDPSAEGTRTATVSVWSNDATQDPYTFSIQGDGVIGRDVFVSGITNPATANGIYTYQGIQNEFQYWKNTISGYYIYNKTYQGYHSWNIDADNDDTHVNFFANDHLEDASPVNVTLFTMDRGSGASGIPLIRYSEPKMTVLGNSSEIMNGDQTPSVADDTEFGQGIVGSDLIVKEFIVKNDGNLLLTLTGAAPYVTVTGANASDFNVSQIPANEIPVNGTTRFQVTFRASVVGVRSATISIASNDATPVYSFNIQGSGITASTITTQAVTGITSTTAIAHGTITVSGLSNPAQFGIAWSTSVNPTVELTTKTELGAITSSGPFTSVLSGLSANTTYYVRAYFTNSTGTGYGEEVHFTTLPTMPAAPIIGTATAGDSHASVSFTAPASDGGSVVTEYTVTSNTGIQGHGTASPVIVSGLTNGSGYYFTVTAWNSVGESISSAVSNVVVPYTAPTAVTDAANAVTSSGATLHGLVNANGAGTEVSFEYGTTTNYGSRVTSTLSPLTGTINTSYNVYVAGVANTTYHFRVVAVNAAGTTYGMDQTFSTSVMTDLYNPEAVLTLYPNPATDGFRIECGTKPTLVSIYNLSGSLILSQETTGMSYIDIHSLQRGMYIVKTAGLVAKLVKK